MTITDSDLELINKIYEIANKSNIYDSDYNGWVKFNFKTITSIYTQYNEEALHYRLVNIEGSKDWYSFGSWGYNVNPNILNNAIHKYNAAKTSKDNETTLAQNSKKTVWLSRVAIIISVISAIYSSQKSPQPIPVSISEYDEKILKISDSNLELYNDISILKEKIEYQTQEISSLIKQLENLKNKALEFNNTIEESPPSTP